MESGNKNSAIFSAALQEHAQREGEGREKGGSGSKKSVCHSHLLGVCPRHELKSSFQNACLYDHPKENGIVHSEVSTFSSGKMGYYEHRSFLLRSERLKDEVKQILGKMKKQKMETKEMVRYREIKKRAKIFEINGKMELASIEKSKLRQEEEKNNKNKAVRIKCKICPQYLPWMENERKAHYEGRVHRAYIKMREYLQKYYSGAIHVDQNRSFLS
ncbi:hypothetical protein NEMIN01_1606 [Nematocida minor]|uniref:uncharacterized protein n=1 Tax=Nematocida minor TaxID=1912983 RepID=UPI00221E53F1|nr:uncharacterized protein NEMIN01_1606 [Nematocida minor]KAI5191622.1 hypothetical protein NEMIN01_1606 [Nematocida minor]